ncbi:hypothetical protein ACFWBX_11035 [Streptomyces sp. NPDC059991]|uniref:hypothetical protein n=1 Tax=Streptomyces sp. NPDC059991 TaxID=3347028 RepID=UPI0036C6C6B7
MNRHTPARARSASSARTALAAALLVTAAALGTVQSAGTAAARPAGHPGAAPSPDAPHHGAAAGARTPGHDAWRDRAAEALTDGRAAHRPARAAALTHSWWGIFPQPGTHDGITATHRVDAAYQVSDADNFTCARTASGSPRDLPTPRGPRRIRPGGTSSARR